MSVTGPAADHPLTLADYESAAQRRFEPDVWDFLAGGAGQERTLAANVRAFEGTRLRPRVLTGIGRPDTEVRMLGRTWAAPVGIAPVAYHALAHPEGEVATARAAGPAGVPLIVSTFASRAFEDIAAAATGPLWLQVYCFRDRATTRKLIERAEQAGFEALVLTVDTPGSAAGCAASGPASGFRRASNRPTSPTATTPRPAITLSPSSTPPSTGP